MTSVKMPGMWSGKSESARRKDVDVRLRLEGDEAKGVSYLR